MLLKAEFEAQMSYLEPSIEAMLTAGEGDSDDDSDDDSGDDNDDEKGDDNDDEKGDDNDDDNGDDNKR